MRAAGTVVTREQLIEDVWDMNWFGSTKTLDVHVSGLRRKLGDDAAEPGYIHTVRGVGFRFSAPSGSLTGVAPDEPAGHPARGVHVRPAGGAWSRSLSCR